MQYKTEEAVAAALTDIILHFKLQYTRNFFLTNCNRCLLKQTMTKVGASQDHIKNALDVKSTVESTLERINRLNVTNTKSKESDQDIKGMTLNGSKSLLLTN